MTVNTGIFLKNIKICRFSIKTVDIHYISIYIECIRYLGGIDMLKKLLKKIFRKNNDDFGVFLLDVVNSYIVNLQIVN